MDPEGRTTNGDLSAARALALVNAVLDDVRSGTSANVLDALEVLRHLREEIAAWEPELISAARAQGVSWVELAPALGVASRQAAERRYLRLRPSASGESTGEARVRAERGKRAADRAVATWARENSASLRQLAGQVSAAAADEAAREVRQALAADDPAALLTPLAGARAHLGEGNPGLAEEIQSVTTEAERLRTAARERTSRT